MAKETIKTTIDANIRRNGKGDITGKVLNGVLNTMVEDYAEQEEFDEFKKNANGEFGRLSEELDGKQEKLTEGDNIRIEGKRISAVVPPKTEVVDDLSSSDTDKALSARQGKVLNEAIQDERQQRTDDVADLGQGVAALETGMLELKASTQNIVAEVKKKQDKIDSFSADEKAAFLVSLGLGKIGVISQKQTWNAVGVEPAYVMSEQVSGFISQDNIDRIISYGFVFNEETGYFELNGLTDISLQEALDIVAAGKPNPTLCDIHFAYKKIRTNLPILDNNVYNSGYFGSGISNQIRMGGMALFSKIEVFVYGQYKQNDNYINSGFRYSTTAQAQHAFRECQYLEKLYIIPGTATRFNLTFANCFRLKELELVYLKCDVDLSQSSLLSAKSIHIMIANADNTGAITITLHSDAKARWEASEYYAEDSQTIVTKNITIA